MLVATEPELWFICQNQNLSKLNHTIVAMCTYMRILKTLALEVSFAEFFDVDVIVLHRVNGFISLSNLLMTF